MARARLLRFAAWLGLLMAFTDPARPIEIGIPPQPLNSALSAWAEQTGYQILFRADQVREVVTPSIRGNSSGVEALETLLAQPGLRYELVNASTVDTTVKPQISNPKPPSGRGYAHSDDLQPA